MFWILCGVVSGICCKYTLKRNEDGSMNIADSTIGNLLITATFILVACIQFSMGIDVYPSLSKSLAEVKTLEKRIVDIKASKYAYEKDGVLVAGSVENYQQSTNLSKYIADLAAKESNYNGKLREAKVTREVFPLYFFSIGWAISDRIDKLPEIGESS